MLLLEAGSFLTTFLKYEFSLPFLVLVGKYIVIQAYAIISVLNLCVFRRAFPILQMVWFLVFGCEYAS